MIKFLISFVLLITLFSCKELKENKITSNINKNLKNVEEAIKNKNTNNKITKKSEINKNEKIFYYLGDPYYIEGVKYVPEENYNYSEIGISTFYGKELHKIKTVNNDLNKVTELLGRHKTLPIPSMVKITNLDNGLSINIKIIDRHNDNTSLIQVSRKVAQLLGFYKDKIATVKIEILPDASKQWKSVLMSLNEPEFDKTISSAPTEDVSISDIDNSNISSDNDDVNNYNPIELSSEEINEFKLFLKVLKFNNYDDIRSLMEPLSNEIKYTSEKNSSYYDLIIGPIDKIEINNLVSYFISKGYKETKIILK